MRNYIKQQLKESMLNKALFGNIRIIVKDPLPDSFDLGAVINELEVKLNAKMMTNIDAIYIGSFPELEQRGMNAAFADGAIYCTNAQDNPDDLIDDIIHETSHAIEEQYTSEIYADGKIISEFFSKRKYLNSYLEYEGSSPPESFLTEPDFIQDVDDYLYKEIGYPTLESLTVDIFLNPYSITSVREYWATGFEFYVGGEHEIVKSMCPKLYKKLAELMK